jgi:hypothetical protein
MQRIDVTSDPSNAVVRTSGCGTRAVSFTTPGHFWASRKATHCTLRFTADGYVPFEMTLRRIGSADAAIEAGAVVTDVLSDPGEFLETAIVAGAFIGSSLAIDWATGGLYELSPSDFEVFLEPAAVEIAPERRPGGTLRE